MSKDDPTGRNTIYETIPIDKGAQKIPLLDTGNIIGLSFLGGGKKRLGGMLTGTVNFGSVRGKIDGSIVGWHGRLIMKLALVFEITDQGVEISGLNGGYVDPNYDAWIACDYPLEHMIVIRSIPTYAESYQLSDEPGFQGKARKDREGGPSKEEGSDYWLDKYRNG